MVRTQFNLCKYAKTNSKKTVRKTGLLKEVPQSAILVDAKKDKSIQVLHVCSEFYPFLKTGGLADVTGALPLALIKLNCDCRLVLPGFPNFLQVCEDKILLCELDAKFGVEHIKIYTARFPDSGLKVYLIDAPAFYDRAANNPYTDENQVAYSDNDRRFALLSWVAAQIAGNLDINWCPDVIHAHDWHAGLTAAYLRSMQPYYQHQLAKTVFTVHNLAYQGLFPSYVLNGLGLPAEYYSMEGLEFYGKISFLKAGLYYSDQITTVSPNYAQEIQEEEQGCGLHGLLKHRKNSLRGIINGVDPQVWSPNTDPFIEHHYGYENLSQKSACKMALQAKLGLEQQQSKPLFAVVSRLTEQKGLHFVLQSSQNIINQGGQLVVLGSGEKELEEGFKALASQYPQLVSTHIKYDEALAHQIIAASDIILVPSRFEPCGLTQLYGMLYGCLPLVHKVGGLANTVVDASNENIQDHIATGFIFDNFTLQDYEQALARVFTMYGRKQVWSQIVNIAMQQDLSWHFPAQGYLNLYQKLINA